MNREQMNIVVVGHVDHGKSTVIGRLLVETDSLPEGKLEQVRANCARNAKPFEYAFLLDALQNEQSQGITIDTARCFFKSKRRDYIIIDAPGHIEFLKNMVTGAARAEAALLVIDAHEGVQENSRRHGYMLSMLGIRQVVVCVNKMDLVGYSQDTYESIVAEYSSFLERIGIVPMAFLPLSAFFGDNLVTTSPNLPWYSGPALLERVDQFSKEKSAAEKALRFPVQDVYKFTEFGDERRIIAGRVETGTVRRGDSVIFLPSMKEAKVASVEEFNRETRSSVEAGTSIGLTLEPEIYVRPGELMVRAGGGSGDSTDSADSGAQPIVGTTFRVNLFWMGRQPMIRDRKYKLKLGTVEVPVWLREVTSVLDASDLASVANKEQVDLYDVGDCILETFKPIAYDRIMDVAVTGRFVIVDNYEIAGGGIIVEPIAEERSLVEEHIRTRDRAWERTGITPTMRSGRYDQRSTLVVIVGSSDSSIVRIARRLEERLFERGRFVYYLGLSNALLGLHADVDIGRERDEFIRRLGEIAHLFTDAGTILITTVPDVDEYELSTIAALNRPGEMLVVTVGEAADQPEPVRNGQTDLRLPAGVEPDEAVERITATLARTNVLIEYNL